MATTKATTAKSKAVKQAEILRISTVQEIKGRLGGIFELPSGMVVRLRNPGGLRAFMAGGNIPNALLKVVQDTIDQNEGKKEVAKVDKAAQVRELTEDPESLAAMMDMLDNIALKTIVEPKVHPFPPEGVEQDEDKLYPSDFDEMDKQFIFQWVQGGVKDLATFRRKFEENVDLVSGGQGSSDTAIGDNGASAG